MSAVVSSASAGKADQLRTDFVRATGVGSFVIDPADLAAEFGSEVDDRRVARGVPSVRRLADDTDGICREGA